MDWTGKSAHFSHQENRSRSDNSGSDTSYYGVSNPTSYYNLPPGESTFISKYSDRNIPDKNAKNISYSDHSPSMTKFNQSVDPPVNPFLRRAVPASTNPPNSLQQESQFTQEKARNPFLKPTPSPKTTHTRDDFNTLRKNSLVSLSHILPEYLRQKVEWKPDQIAALKELRADIVELSLLPSGINEDQQRLTWEHLNSGINKLVSLNQPFKNINPGQPILQLDNRKVVIQDIVSHLQNLEKKLIAAGIAFTEQNNPNTPRADDAKAPNQPTQGARPEQFKRNNNESPSSNFNPQRFESASNSRLPGLWHEEKKFVEPYKGRSDPQIEQFRTKTLVTDPVDSVNWEGSRKIIPEPKQQMGWIDAERSRFSSDNSRSYQSNSEKSASRIEKYNHNDPVDFNRPNEPRDSFRSTTSKYESSMPLETYNYYEGDDRRNVRKTGGDLLGSRISSDENPNLGYGTSPDNMNSPRSFNRNYNVISTNVMDEQPASYHKDRIVREDSEIYKDSHNYPSDRFFKGKDNRSDPISSFDNYQKFPTSDKTGNFERRNDYYQHPDHQEESRSYSKDAQPWSNDIYPLSSNEKVLTPNFQESYNRSDYFNETKIDTGFNKEDTRKVFIKSGKPENRNEYPPSYAADNQNISEIGHSRESFGSTRTAYSTYNPTNYHDHPNYPPKISGNRPLIPDDRVQAPNFGIRDYSDRTTSEGTQGASMPIYSKQNDYQPDKRVQMLSTSEYWQRPSLPKDIEMTNSNTEISQKRSLPVWEFGDDTVSAWAVNKEAVVSVSKSSLPRKEEPLPRITLFEFEMIENRLKTTEHYRKQVRKDLKFLSHVESSLRNSKTGDVTDYLKENRAIEREIRNADHKLSRQIKQLSEIVKKYTKLFKPSGLLIYNDGKDYWCPECDIISQSIEKALKHLNTEEHKAKVTSVPNYFNQDTPWPKKRLVCVGPAHGAEFLYYCDRMLCCTLCEKVFGDEEHAMNHLQSVMHNSVYKTWLSKRETYETEYLKGKNNCLEKIAKEKLRAKQEDQELRRKEREKAYEREQQQAGKMKPLISDMWKEVTDAEQGDTNKSRDFSTRDCDLEITKFIPPSLANKNRKQSEQCSRKDKGQSIPSKNNDSTNQRLASKSASIVDNSATKSSSLNPRERNNGTPSKQAPLIAGVISDATDGAKNSSSINSANSTKSLERKPDTTSPMKKAPLIEAVSSTSGSTPAGKDLKRKRDDSVKKATKSIDIFDVENENDVTIIEPPIKKKLPPLLLAAEPPNTENLSEPIAPKPSDESAPPNDPSSEDQSASVFVPRNLVKGAPLSDQKDGAAAFDSDGDHQSNDAKETSNSDRVSSLDHISIGVLPPPVKILPRKLRKK